MNNIKLEVNEDNNVGSDDGCLERCGKDKRDYLNDVKQEIKQESELIIEDADSKWYYPFGLDEEEREYQQKYDHQNENWVKTEDTVGIYSIEEVNENSNDDEDGDENSNDGDYVYDSGEEDDDIDDNVTYIRNTKIMIENDGDDDYLTETSVEKTDVYNPNVHEIDKCLKQKYVALECHLCQKQFSKCCLWTKHVQKKHGKFITTVQATYECWTENMSVCKECNKQLNYKSNQLLHYLLNHTSNPTEYLVCKVCGYKDYKVSRLQEHMQTSHSQIIAITHKCPLCYVTFKQQTMLQFHFMDRHFREFQEKFVYNCHMCEQTSFDGGHYYEYLEHLIGEHSLNTVEVLMFKKFSENDCADMYKCDKCLKLFVNKGLHNFLEHYLTHNSSFLWSCKHCRNKFIYQDFKPLHLCPKMLRFWHEENKTLQSKHAKIVPQPTCSKKGDLVETDLINKSNVDVKSWQQFENCIQHICPFCNQSFIKFHEWQLHMRECHQIHTLNGLQMSRISNEPDKLKCLQCFIFIRKSTIDLHTHRFQHLPFKPYKCMLCAKSLPNYQTALEHLQNRCQDFSKKPESPVVEAKQQKGYKKHKISKDLENYMEISCVLCKGELFSKVEHLMEHNHVKHNNFKEYFYKSDQGDATKCKVCLNTVLRYDRHTGVSHFLQHLDEKPYKCKKCQRSHSLYRRCKLHITKYHPIVSQLESTADKLDISNEFQEFITFACPECNESLLSHKQWDQHVNLFHNFFERSNMAFVDNSDGKQRCKECNAVLNTSIPKQQIHKLSHMPYKSFICLLCHHRFITLPTLQRHLNLKHFTKGNFECPMCSTNELTTVHERTEHIKNTHPQPKWPKKMCVLCFQIFKDLKKHMESHEVNPAKYYCDICGTGIKYFKDYEMHMVRIHNRKKSANAHATSTDKFEANKRKSNSPRSTSSVTINKKRNK